MTQGLDISKYLAGILRPHLDHTEAFVKYSATLAQTLHVVVLTPQDLLVSLDVVSLFTQVPLQPTTEVLSGLFSEMIVKLFKYVLWSTYFTYNGQLYEQMDGVAMGSPLSSGAL